MEQRKTLDVLRGYPVLSRDDLWEAMNADGGQYSRNTACARLQQYLKAGLAIRVGRNQYTVSDQKMSIYDHTYS